MNLTLLTNVQNTKTSDEDIVALYLKTRNQVYFDKLYTRYSGKIYGRCISLLKNETLAQDAVQEVFVKILLNLSKFSERSRFSTWVYSITYNFCIDYIRRNKRKTQIIVDKDIEGLDQAEEVEDNYILETEISRLKVILEEITAEDKAVLLMKYQDSLSIKEMMETLQISESAVKMRLKRAKHRFKRIYDQTFKNEGV